jgi:C4-type Zn-finger protein
MTNKFISKGTPVQSKRDPPASAGNVSAVEGILSKAEERCKLHVPLARSNTLPRTFR